MDDEGTSGPDAPDASRARGPTEESRRYDAAHFDEVYAERDGDPWGFFDSEYEHRKVERTLSALRSRLAPGEPDAILDLGCGNGAKTARLADAYPDADVLGIDVSAAALEVARERAPAASYERAEVGAFLATAEAEYDVIVDVECCCYLAADRSVTELLEVAGELRTALVENGLFVGTHVHMPGDGEPTIEEARTARVVREVLESELELVGRQQYVDQKQAALDEDEPAEQPYEVWTMERA